MSRNRLSRHAFTLVELLMVMAIISILTSLAVLGLKSLMSSKGLTGAGDQMGTLFAFARQEAIAKDTMTAAVLVTTPNAGPGEYRALSIWELSVPPDGSNSGTWVQASKWQTLPQGIIVDNAAASSTFLASATFSPALPATMSYLGTTLNTSTDCAVQVFLPSGRLMSSGSNPYVLQLVEGFYNGTTPTYLHPNATNSSLPANYVQYIFSTASGEPKIVRP